MFNSDQAKQDRRQRAESVVRELFASAGIGLEGQSPGDIVVKNPDFYERLLSDASIGLGESFMDEWWDCDRLELFIEKILRANMKQKITGSWRLRLITAH